MILRNLFLILLTVALFQSCSSDDDGMGAPPIVDEPVLLDIEVGGSEEPYSVFVELSSARQTQISRDSWDLGFYSGDEGYYVVINTGAYMMAQPLNKTDLSEVSTSDTVGMIQQMDQFAIFNAVLENPRPDWLPNSVNWIDHSTGDLEKTAIRMVAADDEANPVHIVNRGWDLQDRPRGWMKVRVLRSGGGYELQFAEIGNDDFQTVQIQKSPDFNFTFFNFDNGIVEVEPPKAEWDLAFSSGLALFRFAGVLVPYAFKDYVYHNRYGVEIAPVIFEDDNVNIIEKFNEFSLEDVNDLDFNSEINTIGSGWRTIGNPQFGGETAVRSDRLYIVKDVDGNFFKLLFAGMLSDTGERGHPSIQYELLQP
jgi:hypothetical protein